MPVREHCRCIFLDLIFYSLHRVMLHCCCLCVLASSRQSQDRVLQIQPRRVTTKPSFSVCDQASSFTTKPCDQASTVTIKLAVGKTLAVDHMKKSSNLLQPSAVPLSEASSSNSIDDGN